MYQHQFFISAVNNKHFLCSPEIIVEHNIELFSINEAITLTTITSKKEFF